MILAASTICSSKLAYEEALDLARKGQTNVEVVEAFREHYLNSSVKFEGRPTAMVYSGSNLVGALIDLSNREPRKATKLLEEAVILCQESLSMIPQERITLANLKAAQRNLLARCRKDSLSAPPGGGLDFDFIEIGTSDYDCLAVKPGAESKRGVSVEPVSLYFDKLPARNNLTKIQAAVVDKHRGGGPRSTRMYFVSPALLAANPKWPEWVRGCNSAGKRHPSASAFLAARGFDPEIHMASQVARANAARANST